MSHPEDNIDEVPEHIELDIGLDDEETTDGKYGKNAFGRQHNITYLDYFPILFGNCFS